jgi:hypothetical protein
MEQAPPTRCSGRRLRTEPGGPDSRAPTSGTRGWRAGRMGAQHAGPVRWCNGPGRHPESRPATSFNTDVSLIIYTIRYILGGTDGPSDAGARRGTARRASLDPSSAGLRGTRPRSGRPGRDVRDTPVRTRPVVLRGRRRRPTPRPCAAHRAREAAGVPRSGSTSGASPRVPVRRRTGVASGRGRTGPSWLRRGRTSIRRPPPRRRHGRSYASSTAPYASSPAERSRTGASDRRVYSVNTTSAAVTPAAPAAVRRVSSSIGRAISRVCDGHASGLLRSCPPGDGGDGRARPAEQSSRREALSTVPGRRRSTRIPPR